MKTAHLGIQPALFDVEMWAEIEVLRERVKDANESLDDLAAQLAESHAKNKTLREELCGLRDEHSLILMRFAHLATEAIILRKDAMDARGKTSPLSSVLVRDLLKLCHPDKWSNGQPASALAHELSVRLNGLGGKRCIKK